MALKLKHSDRFYDSRVLRDILACMTCRKHRKSDSDSTEIGPERVVAGGCATPVVGGDCEISNNNGNPNITQSHLHSDENTSHDTKISEVYDNI